MNVDDVNETLMPALICWVNDKIIAFTCCTRTVVKGITVGRQIIAFVQGAFKAYHPDSLWQKQNPLFPFKSILGEKL